MQIKNIKSWLYSYRRSKYSKYKWEKFKKIFSFNCSTITTRVSYLNIQKINPNERK